MKNEDLSSIYIQSESPPGR